MMSVMPTSERGNPIVQVQRLDNGDIYQKERSTFDVDFGGAEQSQLLPVVRLFGE